eukprot:CAMPEP_0194385404 /NCGR_PEP_ID=MMETSP0174-20130528/80164_1 /TAXON_ID=216777 /ORGANISM="Proboscia alata, Strain PI-D3" /LENGTH=261 /DNA_ID=CAMNT_0039173535 /DNA_START=95 /DNA_END=881 /DNA_ORIENTATION=-
MSSIVSVHVGQCGNQLGRSIWKRLCAEDTISDVFFESNAHSRHVKARAILVDTEEMVVNETLRSPIGSLFDINDQTITDSSGSGNNWAQGYFEYGSKHEKRFLELTRIAVEKCDSVHAFFMTHSIGGGTGSGLGSRILESLSDDMPKTNRYAISIFPSVIPNCGADDVITSPYNAILSLAKLHDFADSVIPFDNGKLAQLSVRADIASTRNPNFRNFLENQRQVTGHIDSKCLKKGRYINKNTKVPGRRVSAEKMYGNNGI